MDKVPGVLKRHDLSRITGFARDADIRRCLENQGVVVFDGKNGIWTTSALIELAGKVRLGLVAAPAAGARDIL